MPHAAVALSFKALHRVLYGVTKSLVTGFLIVVPIYVAVLLLLKAMKSVMALIQPVALLLPESIPAETLQVIPAFRSCAGGQGTAPI